MKCSLLKDMCDILYVVCKQFEKTLIASTSPAWSVWKASQAYVPGSCLLAHKQSSSDIVLSTLTDGLVMSAFYRAIYPLRLEEGELYLVEGRGSHNHRLSVSQQACQDNLKQTFEEEQSFSQDPVGHSGVSQAQWLIWSESKLSQLH